MDVPFSLAISNTSPNGVLWNPWGTTVPTSVDNTVLTDLSADVQEQYGLLVPRRGGYMMGFIVMGDTADAKVSIGVYDTTLAAFVSLYPIMATVVAGGGVVGQALDTGIYLPLSATQIPVIKYLPVLGTVRITGHICMHWVIPDTANVSGSGPTIPSQFLQDESLVNLSDEATPVSPLRAE